MSFSFKKSSGAMPALLPAELKYCESAISDDNLLGFLIRKPTDLVLFFETACADETWSEHNSSFMKKVISWMTLQAFQGRLPVDLVRRAAKSIQEHYPLLQGNVPENILFKLRDTAVHGSSLLFAAASDYFRDLLFKECRDKNKTTLSLDVPYDLFHTIASYVAMANVPDLWTRGEKEVFEVLKQANQWGLYELSTDCQKHLKRYVTRSNALDLLIQSVQNQWKTLLEICVDYLNLVQGGYKVKYLEDRTLSFRFLNFSYEVFVACEKLKPLISEVACFGTLIEDPLFEEVSKRFPRLKALNISESRILSPLLKSVNQELHFLNLSQCPWLNSDQLKKIADLFPYLRKLIVGSDVQLNTAFWGTLIKFHSLVALDLLRCFQVTDDDLSVILRACLGLKELKLESCRHLTDKGFQDISRQAHRLVTLSLSRTSISDQPLIEIVTRCPDLTYLDLTRCEDLTDKGILEVVKQGRSLKQLTIAHCHVTKDTIESIKRFRPYLQVDH